MNAQDLQNEIESLNLIIRRYVSFFMIFDLFAFLIVVFTVVLAIRYLKSSRKLENTNRYLSLAIKGQEEERSRIAQELHDTVAQDLRYALRLLKGKDGAENAGRNESVNVSESVDVIEKSLVQLRFLSENLVPPDITKNDLCINILNLCQSLKCRSAEISEKDTALDIRFVKSENVDTSFLNEDENLNLFRIVQESLVNVLKHSSASEATVLVRNEAGNERKGVYIFITDDGKGFDPERLSERSPEANHLGLSGIKKRAELIGAEVRIDSAENEGTQISVVKTKGSL